MGQQFFHIRQDVKLSGIAAHGVDLNDAGRLPQLRAHDPVMHGAQKHRVMAGLRRAGDVIHEDLAEARGDGAERRIDILRQGVFNLIQALVDQLSRQINIGAVLKDDRDLRQAITRDGAGVVQKRQARHAGFDREGDALFRFQRRIARGLGVDLHLHIGNVGHGVNGQFVEVIDPKPGQRQRQHQHQPALAQR